MRERWELRVWNENAPEPELLASGRMLGITTQLKLDGDDPVLGRLVAQHRARKSAGQSGLISQAIVTRRYSAEELRRATLFQLLWTKMFSAVGIETGTIYDRKGACLICEAGPTQVGPLRPRRSDMPVRYAAATTLSRAERVVNERVAGIIASEGLTGVECRPVDFSSSRKQDGPAWYQLVVTGPRLAFVPPSRFADSELDGGEKYRCPAGDVAGHMIATEAYVRLPDGPHTDVMESEQYIGSANGHIMPRRMIFVSPRFRETMLRAKIRGWDYEVAHVEAPSSP
jgi:hypothetical protein